MGGPGGFCLGGGGLGGLFGGGSRWGNSGGTCPQGQPLVHHRPPLPPLANHAITLTLTLTFAAN